MIVSASYRSDIPAYYGTWFARRLAAGFCDVPNPYGGGTYRVSLKPEDVAGFVFWSRNIGPFMPVLEGLAADRRPFSVQFTITGYPRSLEPGVIATAAAVDQLRAAAKQFGRACWVWRYDPIIITTLTPPAWHLENFRALAAKLAAACDEVVFSFVHPYRKTRRKIAHAVAAGHFVWQEPSIEEKRALLADLAGIAQGFGLAPTVCAQPELLVPLMSAARCIDAERLSRVAGRPVSARQKGNRAGCLCAEARDIGSYDSCAQGCVYCYAVGDEERAARAVKTHDAAQLHL